jgi:quinol---cytochrome-c reductase cytochrome c subunit
MMAGRLGVLPGMVALALLISAPTHAAPRQTATSIDEGRVLYQQACSSCHGSSAQGGVVEGRVAPALVGRGAARVDFWLSTGRMPLATPTAAAIRKPPAFTPPQRAAIVAYIESLGPGGPPIPVVDLVHVSLVDGGEQYRQNCAACHQAAGIGGALSYGDFAPPLHSATPVQIAEAIRTGPGNMPVFGADTLTDQQVNDIVRYVRYLRHPEDRGGAGLGHSGPAAEGFVGLLGGLGVLMAVIYWIGTKE